MQESHYLINYQRPVMDNLLPLDISSAAMVNEYLSTFPPEISELTFTNLFAWRQGRPVWLMELDETLLFLIRTDICRNEQMLVFGPPVGIQTLAEIFTNQELMGLIGAIRVTSADLTGLPSSFSVSEDRNNSDYVYRVADLSNLSGRRYAKKRSHIKQCLKAHDCVFEMITDQNIEECRDLLNQWCHNRQCDLDSGLCGESRAITTTLDLFDEFELLGGAVRVDGHIQAFSIGERLNDSTAVWHFEKAMPAINGLGQLINHWFTKECLQRFEFVNREQDLGIPGLRQAKESYHPDHRVDKFTVFKE
jgi:hypothetical protein